MLFCGQCGLHLNAGDKNCPRCGTPVDPGVPIEEDVPQDAPTIASPSSLLGQLQTPVVPEGAGDPQRLVLRPEQNADASSYGSQGAYGATRRVQGQEQGYGTAAPGTSSGSDSKGGYPGDLPTQLSQSSIKYQPPQPMRAEYSQNAPQGAPYAAPVQPGVGHPVYSDQQARATSNSRGRNVALALILFGLLLILSAMVLFILDHNNVFGGGTNNGGGSNTVGVTGGALSSQQHAQALIQQYYDDINAKDFSAASTLWQESQRPDLASFKDGFKHTLHDDVAFGTAVTQGDGTVKVSVTVNATEQASDGTTVKNIYTGYYIVGTQNGMWQLLDGLLKRS